MKFGKLSLGSFSGINSILWWLILFYFYTYRLFLKGDKRAWWNTTRWDALKQWAVNDLGTSRCHFLITQRRSIQNELTRESWKAVILSTITPTHIVTERTTIPVTSGHQGFISLLPEVAVQRKIKNQCSCKSQLWTWSTSFRDMSEWAGVSCSGLYSALVYLRGCY